MFFLYLAALFFQIMADTGGAPQLGSVKISGFHASGSGCPLGTVNSLLSPDNEAITLVFDEYFVEKTELDTSTVKKNCRMRFDLEAPMGWSHAIFSIGVEGYADLEDGLVGIQRMGYSYGDGQGRQSLDKLKIEGPFADGYVRQEHFSGRQLVWSSCKKRRHKLVVNSAILIKSTRSAAPDAVGEMTTDIVETSLDGGQSSRVNQQLALLWKKCPIEGAPAPTKTKKVAICSMNLVDSQSQKLIKQVTVKARAKKMSQIHKKLKRKAKRRCEKINSRRAQRDKRDLKCIFSIKQCQYIELQ